MATQTSNLQKHADQTPAIAPRRRVTGASPSRVTLAILLAVALPISQLAVAADTTITVTDKLGQASISVSPGTAVSWNNQDGDRHRFRSTSGPEDFDTGNIGPGETGSVTLQSEGTYTYEDDRNPENSAYHGTIVVVSGAGGAAPPTGGGVVGAAEVRMAGRTFSPGSVSVGVGSTVDFVNDDDRDHTATADGGTFDSGIMAPGSRYTKTFSAPGTFPYICVIHPDMRGTITVTGADGVAPPPATTQPTPLITVTSSDVEVFDFGFSPATKTISAGSSIRFVNSGIVPHTVTDAAQRFDSGFIAAGSSWSRRFDSPGTFNIFCTLHPQMKGTVTVTDAAGTAPPPPTVPPSTATPIGSGAVELRDFRFSPTSVTVKAGDSLQFVNTGAAVHTVTATDRTFDSGLIKPGGRFTRRFTNPGIISIICTLHPEMRGTVTVTDDSGTAPSTSVAAAEEVVEAEATDVAVRIVDLDYQPQSLSITTGTRVVWSNAGVAPHTVTARDETFTSQLLEPGDTYSRVFDQPGVFEYFCTLHPNMVAWVRVDESLAGGEGAGNAAETASPPRAREASVAIGWLTLGVVGVIVFGGGGVIFAQLRRELLRS